MKFYSQSWEQIMAMPLRVFWMLNAQIVRLRAEENLEFVDLFLLGGGGATAEMVNEYRSAMRERLGTPMRTRDVVSATEVKAGLAKLASINAQMVDPRAK